MGAYVAGIDAGTTGTTVLIADLQGKVIGSSYQEYPCSYPRVGWVEQDMNTIWNAICDASKQAIAKAGVNASQIASVGFSSQRGTFVGIDRNWECIHESIVWSDTRASDEIDWLKQHIDTHEYYNLSGLSMSVNWSYAKFKWLRDHRPDVYEKTWKFVNGQEWFLHKLGAEEEFTDPASITLNGMMDVAKLDWSDRLLKLIGVDREKLMPVKHPMRRVGEVSPDVSQLTGFASGTPMCVGGGDQQCAAVGAGVIKAGMSEITIGTGSVLVAHADQYNPDPDEAILFGGHAVPGKWDMEGVAMSSGNCLRWYRDVVGRSEKRVAAELGLDAYDLIGLEAAQSPPGSKGMLFFPFFSGQSAPYYHDDARGGALGLSNVHGRSETARAIMEGVAFEQKMIVQAMERRQGRPFDSIRLSGGGAKSHIWSQIQADVYGRPVVQLEVPECTTLGAAILGAVGSGVFSTIEEAVNQMVHPKATIEPNDANREMYQDLSSVFRDAFLSLRDADVYTRLRKISTKYW